MTIKRVSYSRSSWRFYINFSITVPYNTVMVLAIRQCAACASTLITHKHSRQKKTTEIKEIYAPKSISLLNLLLA